MVILWSTSKNKVLMILYLALSFPLFKLNEIVFYLITGLGVLFLLKNLEKNDLVKYKNDILYCIIYTLYMKFFRVILYLIMLIMVAFLIEDTKFNNSIPLVVILCWGIAFTLIFYICDSLYFILKKTREIVNSDTKRSSIMIILMFIVMVFIFIIPDIAFGFAYNLYLSVFGGVSLSVIDSIHLSMIIGNTLPVGEHTIEYITLIESNRYIFTFQFVHIILNKVINVFVVGIILNYLLVIINLKKIEY